MAFNQKLNFPVIVTVGLAGVLLLVVFITGTQAWFASEQTSMTEVRIATAVKSDWVTHRDQQLQDLQQPPHWADSAKTKIAIPIEMAMSILAKNHGVVLSTPPTTTPN